MNKDNFITCFLEICKVTVKRSVGYQSEDNSGKIDEL